VVKDCQSEKRAPAALGILEPAHMDLGPGIDHFDFAGCVGDVAAQVISELLFWHNPNIKQEVHHEKEEQR